MKEIAGAIKEGAQAFLFAEYKILVIFVVVLFVLIGLFTGENGIATGWGFLQGPHRHRPPWYKCHPQHAQTALLRKLPDCIHRNVHF